MARILTKELVLRLVKKLGATKVASGKRAHDLYVVMHEGTDVARLSIRRGSNKEAGHDYLISELGLNPHKARLLAQCALSKEEWIEILRRAGRLSS